MTAPEAAAALAAERRGVERALRRLLAAERGIPRRLKDAMGHSLLAGGKRLRPILVLWTWDAVAARRRSTPADREAALVAACGLEMLHTYSLIHDDLPAMDDDALRRGKPTTHIAFDEATAILAGDALQTRAFGLLADAPLPATLRVACLQTLAHASGASGMCGGQALDIDATGQQQTLAALTRMHALKTGALIRAAVRMGALCGQAHEPQLAQLDSFADALGLAFQVRDDILDVEASSEQLGKTAGKDQAQDKSTFPALLGMDGAKAQLRELAARMQATLADYGEEADALRALATLAVERDH